MMSMSKKGPHFSNKLRERRIELMKRLIKEPDRAKWVQIRAEFAFDMGLREEKVEEYYKFLIKAGKIVLNGNGH